MRLSDIMGAMHLASYAEIALVLFLLAFLTVVLQLAAGTSSDWEAARFLPLDDDPTTPRTPRRCSRAMGASGETR